MTDINKEDVNTHFKGKTFFLSFETSTKKGHRFQFQVNGRVDTGFVDWIKEVSEEISSKYGELSITNCKII